MLKTKQDYIQCICREMEQFIPRDRHIRIEPASVVKTNDRSCSGLTFFDEEIGGGPTVWMEKPYDEYMGGAGIRTQAFELWYRTVLPQLLRTPLPEEMDTGLDRLSFKLLDGSRNRAYLADKPHVPVGNGFVYTFVSKHVHPNDPDYVFVITEAVLARAGLDAEELYRRTRDRIWETDPPVFVPFEALYDYPDLGKWDLLDGRAAQEEIRTDGIGFILTTRDMRFGASALFYPGMPELLRAVLQEEYYAVPVSVHEFYVFRRGCGIGADAHREILERINLETNDPDEVLSDAVLRYDDARKALCRVPPGEAAGAEGSYLN